MKDYLIIIPTTPGNEGILDKCLHNLFLNTEQDFDLFINKNDFKGFSKAVNRGLRLYKDYKYIILLNDDVIVMQGWLEKALKIMNEKNLDMIGHLYKEHHIPFWFVIFKNKVIEKVGLLDERFEVGEWEDVDYCIRTEQEGFKIGDIDMRNDIVGHLGSRTLSRLDDEKIKIKNNNKKLFKEKYKGTKWENFWN